MDLEELNSKLDQNPDGNWKMRTLSELKDELEKIKRKSNSLGRENSDIGFKKWGEKRSNSTEKEAVKLLLNQTEQLPLKERIKELTKMIKTLVKYNPPRQLKIGENMDIEKINEALTEFLNESDVPDMKTAIMRRLAADADGRDRNKMLFADDEDELGAMEMLLSNSDEITPDVENLADAFVKLNHKFNKRRYR